MCSSDLGVSGDWAPLSLLMEEGGGEVVIESSCCWPLELEMELEFAVPFMTDGAM